jgi:hypothetical protein
MLSQLGLLDARMSLPGSGNVLPENPVLTAELAMM